MRMMIPLPVVLFIILCVSFIIAVIWTVLYRYRNTPQDCNLTFGQVLLREFCAFLSSAGYGIGLFLLVLPVLLIGWYINISASYSEWFSIAPWPFSAFSSFGDQVALYVLLLGLGVGFSIIGMTGYKLNTLKDRISPAKIPFVSVLRGVGILSVMYPLLIERYLEWLYSLPAKVDSPYSLAFSNLLKGPFPMSWFASGKFLLAMYMSAVLFGIVLVVIAEIIREKTKKRPSFYEELE